MILVNNFFDLDIIVGSDRIILQQFVSLYVFECFAYRFQLESQCFGYRIKSHKLIKLSHII